MRIGILGAGNIGGNIARLSARAGHEVQIGFSRNPHTLAELADQIGATVGTPAQVAGESDVIVLSVPWGTVDDALDAAGGPAALRGRLVIDTTNQFELRDGELAVIDLGAASAAEIG
ncbi:MAG TPA: NAD(P)-binding domain-containing protein, partial [Pseudonocardia sp.]